MENNNKLDRFYIRVIRSASPSTEKLTKEQLNHLLAHNPKHGIERIKKIKTACCIDSSYYLG